MPAAATRHFDVPSTHWTLVQAVQGGNVEEAARAMEELCKSYWHPIYAFLRRDGHSPRDAEDQTQAFFHRLITEHALLAAPPGAGKLRSWLLGVLPRDRAADRLQRDRDAHPHPPPAREVPQPAARGSRPHRAHA